jgi:hypothetical protein
MTTETITFRVAAAERAEIAARAERDGVSVSDYIRVRLGLRGEGAQNGDGIADAATDGDGVQAQLAEHDRRLTALETHDTAIAGR